MDKMVEKMQETLRIGIRIKLTKDSCNFSEKGGGLVKNVILVEQEKWGKQRETLLDKIESKTKRGRKVAGIT